MRYELSSSMKMQELIAHFDQVKEIPSLCGLSASSLDRSMPALKSNVLIILPIHSRKPLIEVPEIETRMNTYKISQDTGPLSRLREGNKNQEPNKWKDQIKAAGILSNAGEESIDSAFTTKDIIIDNNNNKNQILLERISTTTLCPDPSNNVLRKWPPIKALKHKTLPEKKDN